MSNKCLVDQQIKIAGVAHSEMHGQAGGDLVISQAHPPPGRPRPFRRSDRVERSHVTQGVNQEFSDRTGLDPPAGQGVAEVDHGRVGKQDSGHRWKLRWGAMAIRMLDESEITDEGRRLRAELEAEGERLIQQRRTPKTHRQEPHHRPQQ